MTIFATDFGASAGIAAIVCSAWAVVLLVVGIGVWRGSRLLDSDSPSSRKSGRLVLLLTASLPLFCCVGPPLSIRFATGNFPISANADDRVHEGMTMDEVRTLLGTPHDRNESQDGEWWYYYTDSFSINFVCIHFGSDGRVTGRHIN
jgi:hypothetical protein